MNNKHTAGVLTISDWSFGRLTIDSETDSQALQKWRREHPSLAHNGFTGTQVAVVTIQGNGSGPDYGPPEILDKEEAEANARRLVHCWNCHDLLVEALENLIESALMGECKQDTEGYWPSSIREAREALQQARPAVGEVSK